MGALILARHASPLIHHGWAGSGIPMRIVVAWLWADWVPVKMAVNFSEGKVLCRQKRKLNGPTSGETKAGLLVVQRELDWGYK